MKKAHLFQNFSTFVICLKLYLKAKITSGGSPEPPEVSGGPPCRIDLDCIERVKQIQTSLILPTTSRTAFLSCNEFTFMFLCVAEALETRDHQIICKTLKVTMTLANLDVDDGSGRPIKAGAALVPYYRQLLPVLNMFKMRNGKLITFHMY